MRQRSRSSAQAKGPQPNWRRWGSLVDAILSEAVALSCDLDPDISGVREHGRLAWLESAGPIDAVTLLHIGPALYTELPDEFIDRLAIAANQARAGALPASVGNNAYGDPDSEAEPRVRLADFAQWATTLPEPWTLPEKFPRRSGPAGEHERRWPWGRHETSFLRVLAQVGVEYFGSGTGAAPLKKVVQARIKECDPAITDRTAEEMAKILCG